MTLYLNLILQITYYVGKQNRFMLLIRESILVHQILLPDLHYLNKRKKKLKLHE